MPDDLQPLELPPAAPLVDPVGQWRITGEPADLGRAVDSLQPKINYHLHRYGLGDDPLAKGQARALAATALKTFNPDSGASLHTWLDRSMQPLSRFKRLRATAVRVPEKIQLDQYRISTARTDFEEEHGREPELDELADRAGLSVKRLDQVHKTFKKMTTEGAFEGNLPGGQGTDFMDEAMEAVWDEADKRDRLILEHRAGYGGKPVIQPKDLAVMLNISPVELSRRSSRLGAKLDEIMEALER